MLVGGVLGASVGFSANPQLAELVTTSAQVLASGSLVLWSHVKGHSAHPWNDLADSAVGDFAE
eukprot:9632640-Lingulodinium_polyedra.AAC.1